MLFIGIFLSLYVCLNVQELLNDQDLGSTVTLAALWHWYSSTLSEMLNAN